MQNNSLVGSWFVNDFHRKNSMAAGGTTNVIASLLAGAETGTDSQNQGALSDYQRECQLGTQQEAVIEQWAKASGLAKCMKRTSSVLKQEQFAW